MDHKGRDVHEPFRVATTELTIQKVDMFPEEENVRRDGNRRFTTVPLAMPVHAIKKWQRESAK